MACRTERRITVFCSSLKVAQSGLTVSASSFAAEALSPRRFARASIRSIMSALRRFSRSSRRAAQCSRRCSERCLTSTSTLSKSGTCSGFSFRSSRTLAKRCSIRALACSARRWRHSSRRCSRVWEVCSCFLSPPAEGTVCGWARAKVLASAAMDDAAIRTMGFMEVSSGDSL